MVYLNEFHLQSADDEWQFFRRRSKGCYDSFYPYQFFPQQKELSELFFSDITILCGSNGSGKSTLLNVIAEKLELKRETPFNKTDFFDPYINGCWYELTEGNPEKLNGWKNGPRGFNAEDPENIESFLEYCQKLRGSSNKYIRSKVGVDERTYSNGENGFKYFTDAIQPGGLYLLDEPENSLSSEMQLELVQYIQGMARFYDCQFIMSTHSPFILSIPYARIYNMDEVPVKTCNWTELPNIRIFYDFFKDHANEFE